MGVLLDIILRAQAKALGLKRYFTGKPCKNGHVSERSTAQKVCIECRNINASIWKAKFPDKVRAAHHKYIAANRDKQRAWWAANAVAARRSRTAWAKRNPENVKARAAKRRAIKLGADGFHTKYDILEIRKAQKDKCAYCKVKLAGGGHVDHIIPLSKGGSNSRDNLQLACGLCNIRKGAKHPQVFARELGMLL
jgi:5-methylcytosine-specific restriction endonuclease McrA